MAQKKAHEVDAWLARPDNRVRIVLIYGPDRGLVSERARAYAATTGAPLDDPFSVVRLDATDFDKDPGRLIDEASTVSMFSDKRLVWVRNAGSQKALADSVKHLLDGPPTESFILIEASDLKKGLALRNHVEGAAGGMALPCYADEGRSIDGIIDESLEKAGMTISLDARHALKRSLGGDRMASRGEIEKLLLYVHGRKSVELDDVTASIGDVSSLSFDEVVDAVLNGKAEEFDTAFRRLVASGGQTYPILAAVMRQFQALEMMRGAMDADRRDAASIVASARPPVFFSRRKLIETSLVLWTRERLAHVLGRLQSTVLNTRRNPQLAEALSRQVLLGITLESARAKARQ